MDAVILREEENEYYSKFLIYAATFSYIRNNIFITCADGWAYAIGIDKQ